MKVEGLVLQRNWASPISVFPGLSNLYRVSSILYRSARPSKEGFEYLNKRVGLFRNDLPIKTVLYLKTFFNKDNPVLSQHLESEDIVFNIWNTEDRDVIRFLHVVTDPTMQPVLVHCKYGSDRTGMMVAIYRIVIEGWSKTEAIDEMVNGGFGFGDHWVFTNLISYIKNLDVNAIKNKI